MRGTLVGFVAVFACSLSGATTPQKPLVATPDVTAAQVIARNVAARGGLEAWRKVETMAWIGHVDSSGDPAAAMPFAVELGRPNKTRFEITSMDRRFTRIFDGTRGWRLRPAANGAPEVKPFSSEEANYSRDEYVIDGPLIDYQAKRISARLAGLDEVGGLKAYLLELTLPSGASRRVWIDAQSFLEVRVDRPSTNPLVKGAPVSVYYSDYRTVDGLKLPFRIESRSSDATRGAERLVIDSVAVNPTLSDQAFAKPPSAWKRHALVRVESPSSAPANARTQP